MYDPGLAARLDEIMSGMLVIRNGTDGWDAIAGEAHVRPMDLTGRVMRGWAMIAPEGLGEDDDLQRYVDMAIMFCAGLPPKTKS